MTFPRVVGAVGGRGMLWLLSPTFGIQHLHVADELGKKSDLSFISAY